MVPLKKEMVRASLIDRLVDQNPLSVQEARPMRSLTREEFRETIRRDLGWLLNTRTPVPAGEYDRRELTVIDYGIPDFGAYSPANPEDRTLMARRIKAALNAFESRLQEVRITVEKGLPEERTMTAVIKAMLVVENVREAFSFMTILQPDGTWEILEHESR